MHSAIRRDRLSHSSYTVPDQMITRLSPKSINGSPLEFPLAWHAIWQMIDVPVGGCTKD